MDAAIPGYLVIPDGLKGPAPAVLLLHWHSGSKEGPLFSSEEQNVLEPLLQRGYVLMAIDSYFNGERLGRGPAGAVESNIMIAIDYLASRPEVDRRRIGASGMSMGSTGAWWLVQSFQDWLKDLATITRNRIQPRLSSLPAFTMTTPGTGWCARSWWPGRIRLPRAAVCYHPSGAE